MIIALLLGLSGTVLSGLMIYAIEENAGPLAGWVTADNGSSLLPAVISTARADEGADAKYDRHESAEEFWEDVHEIFANLMLLLIAVHVAGVLYSSHVERENLVRAMVTGRKRL